jgi:hypothetical protein
MYRPSSLSAKAAKTSTSKISLLSLYIGCCCCCDGASIDAVLLSVGGEDIYFVGNSVDWIAFF